MPSTTRYRRGDIVLVPFPFTVHLQPIVEFAYITGWRTPSEILPLERTPFGRGHGPSLCS
jgi:hypothetical protein